MYKDIFEYQKKELQIMKIKKDSQDNSYSKIISNTIATVKTLQEKTDKLGKDAEIQLENFAKLKASLENLENEISEIDNQTNLTSEEMAKIVKDYGAKLTKLQSNITKIRTNIEKINKTFAEARVKAMEAKKNHKEAKEKQEMLDKETESKISKLSAEMKDMEKTLDSKLLKKYNECKEDIFPVYVLLMNDNACGGCMQNIATNELNKLKEEKSIVCEHCGRIIVDKD
ncbi:MAG: zinc ribbon domain-containing protein [Christensenellales bacterium]